MDLVINKTHAGVHALMDYKNLIRRKKAEPKRLYKLTVRGADHTYELRGSDLHAAEQIAEVISDLTGYRVEYVVNILAELDMEKGQSCDDIGGSAIEASCMPMRFVVTRMM